MKEPPPDLPPSPLKKDESAWKRYLLGCTTLIGFGIALLGIVLYFRSRYTSDDPAEVEAVAQELLTFTKPAGFEGYSSRSVPNLRMADLRPRDARRSHDWRIIIVDRSGREDPESLRKRIAAHQENHGGTVYVHHPLPAETFTVRGKQTPAQVATLTILEGRPKQREYKFVLNGNAGVLLMVTIAGPDGEMTHEWVQRFLDSVK